VSQPPPAKPKFWHQPILSYKCTPSVRYVTEALPSRLPAHHPTHHKQRERRPQNLAIILGEERLNSPSTR
jgi:hypothetical protein